jgi:hypothetical protein
MEDVASVAHAAIVKRDWGALQPLLHPYLRWVQADDQVVRGRTKVIGMLQAIGGVYTFVRSPREANLLTQDSIHPRSAESAQGACSIL